MLVLLIGVGLYFTLRTGFFQIRRFPQVLSCTLRPPSRVERKEASGGISPFQALTTALSGTLGTGSMAGVATAITLGGPGAILWMLLSAFVSMMTKYAEIVLAVRYRVKDESGAYLGGPMLFLEKGLNMRKMAVLYAVLGLLASFGIGNMVQSNTIAQVAAHTVGMPPLLTGIVCALLVGVIILGGVKRIAGVTMRIVPAMSALYLLGAVAVLALNASKLPSVLHLIWEDAFQLRAVAGGAAGAGLRVAMRYGIGRGVFSNEAGMGSAAIAHASADTRHPAEQGMWGILEVAIDTVLVCTISGVVVLAAGPWQSGITGSELLSQAFEAALGLPGRWMVAVSLAAFAFSTFLGWSHYGEQCLKFLGGQRYVPLYRAIFTAAVALGAVMTLELAWSLSDVLNGLMIPPNLMGLILLSPEVIRLTRERFGHGK